MNTLRVSCPKKTKRYELLAYYGISLAEYEKMLDLQNGACAICGKRETVRVRNGTIRHMAVDHDHKTGKIRGLLCSRCNPMLGLAKDDSNTLLSAVRYLIRTI